MKDCVDSESFIAKLPHCLCERAYKTDERRSASPMAPVQDLTSFQKHQARFWERS